MQQESNTSCDVEKKPLTLDEAIAHVEEEVARNPDSPFKREHRQLAEWLRELRKRRDDAVGDAAKLREALEEIDKNTDLLDIAKDIAPHLHPSHSFVAVQIRKIVRAALSAPAPTKVKAYTALHRTRRDCPWYMSQFIYREAREFDELRRLCAKQCDREGDSYGAAMWRDDVNIKIIPVEVVLPDGVEMIDLDTTSSQPTKEGNP